ncbi:MAG: hypothetical protein QOG53_1516 [Frankiales bacterium]|jgi:hypothetical protein|nr:hypothetical protein [Frankiales bacterium]
MSEEQAVSLDPASPGAGPPRKAAAITWPLAVDRRLDQLVQLANQAGARTQRSELAAAIIAGVAPDARGLLDAVISFRTQDVRDVILGVPKSATAVRVPRYGRGRRNY